MKPARWKTKNRGKLIAQFELRDGTGSILVETLGSCFASAMELPRDGEVIELTAQILVFPAEGRTEQVIKAVTQNIVIMRPVPQDLQHSQFLH